MILPGFRYQWGVDSTGLAEADTLDEAIHWGSHCSYGRAVSGVVGSGSGSCNRSRDYKT